LIVAGEHAREVITTEVALGVLESACNGGIWDAAGTFGGSVNLILAPLINEGGRMAVERG